MKKFILILKKNKKNKVFLTQNKKKLETDRRSNGGARGHGQNAENNASKKTERVHTFLTINSKCENRATRRDLIRLF